MTYTIEFEKFIQYDAGQPGITLPVELRLVEDSVFFDAKLNTVKSSD
jgi:hypothetical protein